jgi:hypothetical protein
MRVVELVEHMLEQSDQPVPRRNLPQVGGIERRDVRPRRCLGIEVRVAVARGAPCRIEVPPQLVGRLGAWHERRRDGDDQNDGPE